MLAFLYMLVEELEEFVRIRSDDRDEQVRRKDVGGLEGEGRGKRRIDVFEYREGEDVVVRIQVVVHHDALFRDLEAVQAGMLGDRKRERPARRYDEQGEDEIPEERTRYGDRYSDDAERPIPISTLLFEGIFHRFPLEEDCASHRYRNDSTRTHANAEN